jgi:hypothetical protein
MTSARPEPDGERHDEGQHGREACRRGAEGEGHRQRGRRHRDAAGAAVLASKSGRLERNAATRMESVLTAPTAAVAPWTALFDDTPACLNTSGLHSTMASALDARRFLEELQPDPRSDERWWQHAGGVHDAPAEARRQVG